MALTCDLCAVSIPIHDVVLLDNPPSFRASRHGLVSYRPELRDLGIGEHLCRKCSEDLIRERDTLLMDKDTKAKVELAKYVEKKRADQKKVKK